MRLIFQYQPTTGGIFTVVLADEETPVPPRTQRDAVSGWKPGGRCLVQDNPLPDAANLQTFTRKNRALSISFTVERCHASDAVAAKFATDELGLIGKRGALVDAGPPQVKFSEGVMESVECIDHWGKTTIHRYSFRGGNTVGAASPYPAQ